MLSELINHYLNQQTRPLSKALKKMIDETSDDIEGKHMMCGKQVAALLNILVKISHAKYIVDIGSYIGFSALALAEACPQDGKVLSCEIDARYVEVAQKNMNAHPDGYKVQLILKDAHAFLKDLPNGIELSFLDADKKPYIDYYNQLVEKTKPGGLIIIDDVLWKGEVAQPSSDRIKLMDEFNRFVHDDLRVENTLIPLRNGINLIYKL